MRWVAPFGDPGINSCSHFPRAFRSVPRPSSPLDAKASTRCPSRHKLAHAQPPAHASRALQRSEVRGRRSATNTVPKAGARSPSSSLWTHRSPAADARFRRSQPQCSGLTSDLRPLTSGMEPVASFAEACAPATCIPSPGRTTAWAAGLHPPPLGHAPASVTVTSRCTISDTNRQKTAGRTFSTGRLLNSLTRRLRLAAAPVSGSDECFRVGYRPSGYLSRMLARLPPFGLLEPDVGSATALRAT